MQHFLVSKFLAKLMEKKKGPPPEETEPLFYPEESILLPEEEPILSLAGNEVFCIYEVVEMILSHLPALDPLVFQIVNRTCRDVVNKNHEFQKKLFVEQEPPEGDKQRGTDKSGANEVRWNPFLEHFGVSLEPKPGLYDARIRIERKFVRKLQNYDDPKASWKKMYISCPTRVGLSAFWEPSSDSKTSIRCRYFRDLAQHMDFLTYMDRQCSRYCHRSEESFFVIDADYWNHLRSNEGLQAGLITY